MQFSIVATIAALSATVLGQGLTNIPTCAQNCFGTDNLGSCSLLDVACICGSSTITRVACCVLSSCNAADINSTITFAQTLCTGVGVTLNTTPDCGAASSNASASASASSSASVTGISGTNTPSGSGAATASASGSVAVASAAGAALQTAGPIVGLGAAVFGMLAAL